MRFDAAFLAACERGDVRYVTEALTQIADGLRTHEITEALKRAAKGERRDIINLLAPSTARGASGDRYRLWLQLALAALLDTPGAADSPEPTYTWRCRARSCSVQALDSKRRDRAAVFGG